MAWIFRLLFLHFVSGAIAAPISGPSEFVESSDSSFEVTSNPIRISSFGHLAMDIGLGGTVFLGTVGIAEAVLFLINLHTKGAANRRKDDTSRNSENEHLKDQTQREQDALQVLLDIADKHARKISSDGFVKKFEPLTVPKAIHQSLEKVFKGDERMKVETYQDLKEALSPLLDFEQ